MSTAKDKSTELDDLKNELRSFVRERDWEQFQTPKNLAMALAGEAGELVAEFQWLTAEQSASLEGDQLKAIGEEMADVFIYLVRLADTLDLDLLELASAKQIKNVEKYPAERVRGSARKYTAYDTED